MKAALRKSLRKVVFLIGLLFKKIPFIRSMVLKLSLKFPNLFGWVQQIYFREAFKLYLESYNTDSQEQVTLEEPKLLKDKIALKMQIQSQNSRPRAPALKGLRIVLDMQASQTASSYRGMGRYSFNLAKAMMRNGPNHEFLILLNSCFPESIERIKAEFKGLIPEHQIIIWKNLKESDYDSVGFEERTTISQQLREHFIQTLQPDIIHISSLFEPSMTTLSVNAFYDTVPTAVTFYDLIPYIHQKKYLTSQITKKIYMSQVEQLVRADLLLAISSSARQESIDYLSFPEEKVISISSDASDIFRVVKMSQKEKVDIKSKYGIKDKFLMTIGSSAADLRKNINKLLEAYALLPQDIQTEYQLLLVGQEPSVGHVKISKLVKDLGIDEQSILLPGRVSDEDLVLLCNVTDLFIFPSLHEGFGLPLLEAMRCGALVIGSNNSSIPEVIGLDEALFDAESAQDMARVIEQALRPGEFRNKLKEHIVEQQSKFSWDRSALMALEAFERLARERKYCLPETIVA